MPVRDMDLFAAAEGAAVPVAANRGASGIDGTLASAAGFARGSERRVTLLIGDLAFLHDINSLGLLRSLDEPMVIVLLNNNGGGIFSFLPIAEHDDVFESHFGAPHGLTFEAAAALFELNYACPTSPDAFIRDYEAARSAPRSTLIEVRTDRRENVQAHRRLLEAVVAEVEATL
jgi:2-succinyl-5-enolpyruvyl-6-hydroxy-3-cyclohexene-1-carboxylate synthase